MWDLAGVSWSLRNWMQLALIHPCPSSLQYVGESMQALSVTYNGKGERETGERRSLSSSRAVSGWQLRQPELKGISDVHQDGYLTSEKLPVTGCPVSSLSLAGRKRVYVGFPLHGLEKWMKETCVTCTLISLCWSNVSFSSYAWSFLSLFSFFPLSLT